MHAGERISYVVFFHWQSQYKVMKDQTVKKKPMRDQRCHWTVITNPLS